MLKFTDSSFNFDLLRLQVQNYACQGCSNCADLSTYDLRTRQGMLNYLIIKRTCHLTKIETRIAQLNTQKEKIKGEIKNYQQILENYRNW